MAQLPHESKPKSSGTVEFIEIDSQPLQYAPDTIETQPWDMSGFVEQFIGEAKKAEVDLRKDLPKNEVTCQEKTTQKKKHIFHHFSVLELCSCWPTGIGLRKLLLPDDCIGPPLTLLLP